MTAHKDRDILRRLAGEQAEIAALPSHVERAELWRRLNDLEPVRPLVSIFQIPWPEMDVNGELTLRTTDPFCRRIELGLRRALYQWRRRAVDMIVDDRLYCPIVVRDTGFGIQQQGEQIAAASGVASQHFVPQITCEADIEKIQLPEVTVDWEATERNHERMTDLFDGVIPVERRGMPGCHFAPWDMLVRWWGVEQAMMDLVLRPELVHAGMERLTAAYRRRLDRYEELGVLALNNGNINVGGGLTHTDALPAEGFDPAHVRVADLWGRAMSQIFSDVSPEMHEEFALRYERPWLERFGLAYYGCCEPLHHKIDILRSIRNLRKISISPWADLAVSAKAIARDYVVSFKPNPAHLAVDTWDPEFVRRYLRESLQALDGCTVEIILKDISTVRHEPQRLWDWARVAMEAVAP